MTAPKLVAAGIDSVIHSLFMRKPVDPVARAARTQIEISLRGKDGSRDIYRLLE